MTIELLAAKLKEVENTKELAKTPDGYLGQEGDESEHPLIQEIDALACGLLIESDGRCNFTNINKMKDLGYRVGPGEKDSFGWITGVIYTPVGMFVYG